MSLCVGCSILPGSVRPITPVCRLPLRAVGLRLMMNRSVVKGLKLWMYGGVGIMVMCKANNLHSHLNGILFLSDVYWLTFATGEAKNCGHQDHSQHQQSCQSELWTACHRLHVRKLPLYTYLLPSSLLSQDFFHNPPSYQAKVKLSWGPEVCDTHTHSSSK